MLGFSLLAIGLIGGRPGEWWHLAGALAFWGVLALFVLLFGGKDK